jgi:hypothetical protein
MTDVQHLPPRFSAFEPCDIGQDRITNGLEGLRDQRGTDIRIGLPDPAATMRCLQRLGMGKGIKYRIRSTIFRRS